jgi:ferric iron reductase protein FhuF
METLTAERQKKSIHLDELFQLDQLQTLLHEFTTVLQAPSAIISASQFSKRYSYFLLAPSLRQLLTSGRIANIQKYLDNIELDYDTGRFQLNLKENEYEYDVNYCTKQQIDQYIQYYFAGHLVPLWSSLSKLTGIKMQLLWENTYIYITWMCLHQIESPFAKQNFIYLTQDADGSLFGLSKNPFLSFTTSSPVRKKCCFYFMLPKAQGDKCRRCPLDCRGS